MTVIDHPGIQCYMEAVCAQVKFRDKHREIKMELAAHLQEAVDEYLSDGLPVDEAVGQAITRMGNADMMGKKLNEAEGAGTERWILAVSLIFVSIGLFALFLLTKQGSRIPAAVFFRGLIFTLIAAAAALLAYRFDYRKIESYSGRIYLGTLVMLILTIIFGRPVHGIPYLTIGPFSLDFVDVSPMLFGLSFAGLINGEDWRGTKSFVKVFLLFSMPLLLILAAGSLSAAVNCAVIFLTMFILTGSGKNQGPSAIFAGTTAALISFFLLIKPVGLVPGINHPEIIATGLHTDFIFSYLIDTFGWIAGGWIVALALTFLVRLTNLAGRVKNRYARLLLSGFLADFALGFLWNIGANFDFLPLGGAGLPFISFGGSGLIINGAALGLIFSIYRRRNIGIGV